MDENNFTLEVYHGGALIHAPNNVQYVGGRVDLTMRVDPDRMSIFELKHIVLEMGEPTVGKIYYFAPTGLELLSTDSDVLHMFDIFRTRGVFTIPLYSETNPQPANNLNDPEFLLPADEGRVDGNWDDVPLLPLVMGIEVGVAANIVGKTRANEVGTSEVVGNFPTHAPPFVPYDRHNIPIVNEYDDVYMAGMNEDVGNLSNDSLPEWVRYEGEVFGDTFKSTAESQQFCMNQQEGELVDVEEAESQSDEDDGKEVRMEDWNDQELPDRELRELQGSEDESYKVPEFNEKTDMNAPHLEVGMIFADSRVFRKALIQYCVNHAVDFEWALNRRRQLSAYCVNHCGWHIYASARKDENEVQIKTFLRQCECGRTFKNKHVTSKFISERYFSGFVDNPKWEVGSIKNTVRSDICVDVSKQKSYRAKKLARALIEGDENMQFAKLRDYAHMIMKTNPGSQVYVYCDDDDKFQRIYVRYNAQKVGFLAGCRPIIGLDGTFLKGSFGGQMLAAIARDGNDNCFPLAICIVESECKESWEWFLKTMAEDIGDPKDLGIVFISDRQKGLQQVIRDLFPGVEHRHCMRHIYDNYRKDFGGKDLKDALWNCASALTKNEFDRGMEALKKLKKSAWEWVRKIPPYVWSRSHFTGRAMCDTVVNNMNEGFNSKILPARSLPIISMLEWIRIKMMETYELKRIGMRRYKGILCPNIKVRVEELKLESRNYSATPAGTFLYEVSDGRESRSVDLQARTCECRQWELTGIPCKHAMVAIIRNHDTVEDYVHPCYGKKAYLAAYQEIIYPIPSMDEWEDTGRAPPQPPIIRKPPGRPKSARKKGQDEPKKSGNALSRKNKPVKCGKCKQEGHNSRRCVAAVTGETPWQRRVRMQKAKEKNKEGENEGDSSSRKEKALGTKENPSKRNAYKKRIALNKEGGHRMKKSRHNKDNGAANPPFKPPTQRASWFHFQSPVASNTRVAIPFCQQSAISERNTRKDKEVLKD